MSERFVVREVEGWRITVPPRNQGAGRAGITTCVLDSRMNYRSVGEWHSENYSGTLLRRSSEEARERARELARTRAAELNTAYQREALSPRNGKAV